MDPLVGESVWAVVGRWCWPHWGKALSGGGGATGRDGAGHGDLPFAEKSLSLGL